MQKSIKAIFKDIPDLDDRSAQFLINALEKNNQPGFDYLEFKQSLSALAALNMDEGTAIKSAYATASTMGLTFQHLVNTAKYYNRVLQNEKSQFDKALEQQVNRQVSGKKQEAISLSKTIEQKKAKIQQLQMEIQKHQQSIDGMQAQIDAAKSKIEETQEKFESTFEKISEEINADLEKFNTFLGA